MAEEINYITEIAIPLAALIVSVAAVFFTWRGLKLQRIHNIKTLKPIGKISIGDYESNLFIRIDNYGVGPLIIKSQAVNGNEFEIRQSLLSLLSEEMQQGIRWKNFSGFMKDRVIPAGGSLELLRWAPETDFEKTNEELEEAKRLCRENFKDWTIKITYTDVYGSEEFTDELELSWFGRNL